MQPYQMASEEIRKQGEAPSRIGSFAAGAGLGLAAGKVLPFLSSFIPENTAIKGLEKIDPRFGSFIKTAMNNGTSFDDIKKFISDKISKEEIESSKKPAKENRNIIEQESPELHQFILDEIKNGSTPIQAGAKAYVDKKFMQVINKLKNSHKTNWSDLIQAIYGSGQTAQPSQQNSLAQEAMNPPGSQPLKSPSAELQASQNPLSQQKTQPQSPQMGQGQQALMQMLQQINQKLGS